MKNLKLVLVAMATVLSMPALASKARVDALQNSAHVLDTTNVFYTPNDAMVLPDFTTIEMGSSAIGTTPNAEGGFLKGLGDNAKLGMFLGHGAAKRTTTTVLSGLTFAGYDNPLDVVYATKLGAMNFGLDFMYSATDRKSTARVASSKDSSSAMMLKAGLGADAWAAYLHLGLADTADLANTAGTKTAKFTNAPMNLGGTYTMDTMMFHVDVATGNSKITDDTADTKVTSTTMKLGVINSVKQDANEFFYGIAYVDTNIKTDTGTASTSDTSLLLARMGLEFDAASWLVLRGSLTQPVLLGSTKTDAGTDTLNHLTTVAAGAGIKMNKGMFDFTLSNMATTGLVQANNFGAEASYTYNF